MKQKWLVFGVPVLLLAFSVLVMTSGGWLKKPLRGDDDVFGLVQEMEQLAKDENWEAVWDRSLAAYEAWRRVVNRVQYSVEREMILEISGSLAKMQGAAQARDMTALLQEVYYFYDLWNNLST